MSINIILPDGSTIEMDEGSTAGDVAKEISMGLYNHCVVAKVNDEVRDLSHNLEDGDRLNLLKEDTEEAKHTILHSAAHIMAHAVKDLFQDAKVTIGPALENRFYYDFDKEPPFSDNDLEKIEERMQELIDQDIEFTRKEVSREEAVDIFQKRDEPYKIELLEDIDNDEKISIYESGNFIDLCRGPHIPSTGKIGDFKLLNTAGAYWRGDENNKMLTRIYGTAYSTEEELDEYLDFLEKAKKRDHRKIGKKLDLFHIDEEVGPGLVVWHPNGTTLVQNVKNYWINEHKKHGYKLVQTPHIGRAELWEKSGHTDFYEDGMFSPMEIEEKKYYVKPMNCPFHIKIFNSDIRSYRDLPIKYAELGTVYRYEKSGVLHGLMRVRGFTQDDAHIICTPDQLNKEVEKLLKFTFDFIETFGFEDFEVFISTKAEDKYVGSDKMWDEATNALKDSLENLDIEYDIDEGEATFYGPKIDMKIKDSLGRSWQCSTIQFDFNEPKNFDMEYVDSDGERKRPYMIHRAILGSLERFLGVFIEHTAGNFPLWLAPKQAMVIPISDDQIEEAEKVKNRLVDNDIRAELNSESETVSAKIKKAEENKIPYMLIVGDREIENNTVSVRKHKQGDIGTFKRDEIINKMLSEISKKEEI